MFFFLHVNVRHIVNKRQFLLAAENFFDRFSNIVRENRAIGKAVIGAHAMGGEIHSPQFRLGINRVIFFFVFPCRNIAAQLFVSRIVAFQELAPPKFQNNFLASMFFFLGRVKIGSVLPEHSGAGMHQK